MKEALLERIELFRSLPAEEARDLAKALRVFQLAPGELLFREDDPADHFVFILEGQVEIVKALDTPGERLLSVLGEGDFLGEMSLFSSSRERSTSARARGAVRLAEVHFADFEALLSRQPALAFNLLRELSERMRRSENDTIRDLLEKNRQLSEAYAQLQAAQAQLVEKEKMEHELHLARAIQEGILPKELPRVDGWKLAARWLPARDVSGDYYDALPLANGSLALLVADVTGKGVPAALVMATTRSILRAAAQGDPQPGTLLARVNDLLCPDMPPNMFVTCLFARLDPSSGRLRFANAGHPLPYLHASGAAHTLLATGMPLGLMPEMAYEERETILEPGTGLLLYSDGCTEAHDPQGEMFGGQRLGQLLAGVPAGRDPIPPLLERLTAFTGAAAEQEDDITLLSLWREGI
jgi:serine phosphatase RsbU (regulator of sigma subunit)